MPFRFLNAFSLFAATVLAGNIGTAQSPATDQLVVTVRGVGSSAEAAKKDALVSAVHQAIGSFVDSETLVRDDQLIKDEILQVSDGFVHSYQELAAPRRRDDGLYEVTIKATVRKGKVIERLTEVRASSGGVAGKDVVGEVITKIKNAQQGAALMQKHMNGLMAKLLVARLLDENGKPGENIRPTTNILDDGRVECQWNIEIYFDLKSFYEKVVPQLDKVFTVTSAEMGGPVVSLSERVKRTLVAGYPSVKHQSWRGDLPPETKERSQAATRVFLSIGRDKYGENERFRWYVFEGSLYEKVFGAIAESFSQVKCEVIFVDSEGGVIRQDQVTLTANAFEGSRDADGEHYCPSFLAPEETVDDSLMISPRFARNSDSRGEEYTTRRGVGGDRLGALASCCDTLLVPYQCTFEQEDLEKVVEVRFSFSK